MGHVSPPLNLKKNLLITRVIVKNLLITPPPPKEKERRVFLLEVGTGFEPV